MNETPLDIDTNPVKIPTIQNAKNLFIITLALVAVVGSLMQKNNFWIGLSLTEILLILLPTIFFLVRGKFSPRLILRLNYPGNVALLVGVALGVCVWPLGLWIQINLLNLFSSKSYDILSAVSEIRNSNMVYRLLVMGILTSICEETLFRGYIQTAIENKLGVKQSIIWTTVLFSVFHLVPTTIIAILPSAFLMCWICWKFNSIFPAMLIHISNNFLAPYLYTQYLPNTLGWYYIITIGCGLFIIMTIFIIETLKPAT